MEALWLARLPTLSCFEALFYRVHPRFGDYGCSMSRKRQADSDHNNSRAASPKTLLPSPFASFVSLATAASSLSLRVGGFVGHSAINAARVGSLSGVELGRAILENALFRAGQDVVELSTGRLGKVAAEGILESTVSLTEFERHCFRDLFLIFLLALSSP